MLRHSSASVTGFPRRRKRARVELESRVPSHSSVLKRRSVGDGMELPNSGTSRVRKVRMKPSRQRRLAGAERERQESGNPPRSHSRSGSPTSCSPKPSSSRDGDGVDGEFPWYGNRHRSKCGNSSLHTRAGLSRDTQCSGSGGVQITRGRGSARRISAVSARADSRAA